MAASRRWSPHVKPEMTSPVKLKGNAVEMAASRRWKEIFFIVKATVKPQGKAAKTKAKSSFFFVTCQVERKCCGYVGKPTLVATCQTGNDVTEADGLLPATVGERGRVQASRQYS